MREQLSKTTFAYGQIYTGKTAVSLALAHISDLDKRRATMSAFARYLSQSLSGTVMGLLETHDVVIADKYVFLYVHVCICALTSSRNSQHRKVLREESSPKKTKATRPCTIPNEFGCLPSLSRFFPPSAIFNICAHRVRARDANQVDGVIEMPLGEPLEHSARHAVAVTWANYAERGQDQEEY